MGDWGIKVTKTGKGVTSTDLRDLLMHSNYAMFKYHMDTTSTMTINSSNTSKTITIAHNLGYVPAFMVYKTEGSNISMLPERRSYYTGEDEHIFATADSTNIYIKWKSLVPYLQTTYSISDYWNTYINAETSYMVGKYGSSQSNGAIRFTNIALNKNESFTSATLKAYIGVKGSGSGNIVFDTYGIDEDNTGSFSDPMNRSSTTASTSINTSVPSAGSYLDINVKSIVEEINTRNGWSSGNAIGFKLYDVGTPNDVYIYNSKSGSWDSAYSKLVIQRSGSMTYSFRILVFKDKIS